MTSSLTSRPRFALRFRRPAPNPTYANKQPETLPSWWGLSGIPSFDYSPEWSPDPSQIASQTSASWEPLSYQTAPAGDDWDVWLLLGGRGSGKTRAGAEYVLDHLRTVGPQAVVGVGAPTTADARDVCAEGPSGLVHLAPGEFAWNRSLGQARHNAGGFVQFLGAEEPDRWNGRQWSLLWADELALWNRESWDQAQFGLRLGPHPRAVATTTPKARRWVQELSTQPGTVAVRATTAQNPHLSERVRKRLYARYGGKALGRQELDAEFIEDVEGALWTHARLEANRISWEQLPELLRVVVAIDPSGGSTEGHAEVGIIAAGRGVDGHGYILRDVSDHLSPERWARRAIQLFQDAQADRIIAEVNYGGEMVRSTLRAVDGTVPVKVVTASRSKRIRAEPVSALDEDGRLHMVGVLPVLEDQLTSWVPDSGDPSPDRLDAMVWAVTELLVQETRRFTAL